MTPNLDKDKFFIVGWGSAESRYDPNYHRGIGYALNGWGKLGQVATVKGGKRIPLGETYAMEETGYYYLRVDNLAANGELTGEMKWLTEETYKALERYRIFPGDLLISIAGTIGRVAVVRADNFNGPVILTENCAKIHLNEQIIPEYMALLLQSDPLQKQMERDYIQTTIPKLGLDRIRQIRLPRIPSPTAQAAVVAQWRLALNKFLFAQKTSTEHLASIGSYVLSALDITLPPEPENTIANRIFTAQRKELAGWRYDPQALHPEREGCVDALRRLNSLPLKSACRFVRDLRLEISGGTTYIGLENIESNTGRYVPSDKKDTVSSAFAFRKGQVLFPKLRPYLNKVFFAPFDGLCSTEFHVLEGCSVSSAFLAIFLRSQVVVKQTMHLMSGNTLPRLQTEDIEDLLVPVVDPTLQETIVKEASRRMSDAENALSNAEVDLIAAKSRIEAMLLGEVTV